MDAAAAADTGTGKTPVKKTARKQVVKKAVRPVKKTPQTKPEES